MEYSKLEFENILVPLDGSAFAEHALPVAATLAERSGGCIRLVAIEPRILAMPAEELAPPLRHAHALNRERTKDYLAEVEGRIRGPRHVRTTIEVRDGDPVDGLLAAIEDYAIDVVVMTSHGRGGLRRAWLGSVADELIRRSEKPLLLLKPDPDSEVDLLARRDFGTIIVPLDGSEAAEAALEPAIGIARLHKASITLFRVVTTPIDMLAGPMPYGVVDHVELRHRREAAERYLHELAEQLRTKGIEVSGVAVHDEPVADAIIDYARNVDALIVIATHGRGGFKRLVLGSVADKVIRGAAGPVFAVRPARAAPSQHAGAGEDWAGATLLAASGATGDPRAWREDFGS